MKSHLFPFEKELRNADQQTFRYQALLLWKCIYKVLENYLRKNNDWIMVRHEDLSENPLLEFKSLYEKLDLKWSDQVEGKLEQMTSSDNPAEARGSKTHQLSRDSASLAKSWQTHYDSSEIEEMKVYIYPHSSYYYTDAYWK